MRAIENREMERTVWKNHGEPAMEEKRGKKAEKNGSGV